MSHASGTIYKEGHDYDNEYIEYRNEIRKGLMILVGIEESDSRDDIEWLTGKVSAMRIFDDENGIMNLSIKDIGGECLAISQFTLFASTKKVNRPSWFRAAKQDISEPLYNDFCKVLEEKLRREVHRGVFGADMKVELCNDGPVTILIDSKNRE